MNYTKMAIFGKYVTEWGGADKNLDLRGLRKELNQCVFRRKKDIALKVYHQCNSVTKTTSILGYPTRRTLYTWVINKGVDRLERKTLENVNNSQHPRNPPHNIKMEAIHRCFELGESVKSVAEDIQEPAYMHGARDILKEGLLR